MCAAGVVPLNPLCIPLNRFNARSTLAYAICYVPIVITPLIGKPDALSTNMIDEPSGK